MDFTRRAYGVAALGGGLALVAVVLASPLLLVGAAGVGGWLLSQQWQFVRATTRTAEELTVAVSLTREYVTVDESLTVVTTVTSASPTPLSVTVETVPPVAVAGPEAAARTVELDAGTTAAETSFSVTAPTAGQHQFRAPRITMTDAAGLFRTTLQRGDDPTLTVEPDRTDDVHVGEGGEQLGAFGAFRADQYGEGIDPAYLREYIPGDPADRIDWNATARLGEPHVLEFEVDTDRRTVLVVDHRSSLGEGPNGERKLDYLRQVALAFVAAARQRNQAVGLLTVGDNGITSRLQPTTGERHYANLRQTLLELDTTESAQTDSQTRTEPDSLRPVQATRAADTLEGDDSPFARSLRPFFADTDPYIQRLEQQPLYQTVRTESSRLQGTLVTMILTDDDRPGELREAVDAGTRGTNRVATFITPAALFEPDGFTDLDRAYERYTEFETFRTDLAGRPQVEAYEVGPESRVEALLSARQRGEAQ